MLWQEDKMLGVPLMVLANKQDLVNALPASEVRLHSRVVFEHTL